MSEQARIADDESRLWKEGYNQGYVDACKEVKRRGTGLLDSRGVQIYEGDIVKLTSHKCDKCRNEIIETIHKVIFEYGAFYLVDKDMETQHDVEVSHTLMPLADLAHYMDDHGGGYYYHLFHKQIGRLTTINDEI